MTRESYLQEHAYSKGYATDAPETLVFKELAFSKTQDGTLIADATLTETYKKHFASGKALHSDANVLWDALFITLGIIPDNQQPDMHNLLCISNAQSIKKLVAMGLEPQIQAVKPAVSSLPTPTSSSMSSSSLGLFQQPSQLPTHIAERLIELTRTVFTVRIQIDEKGPYARAKQVAILINDDIPSSSLSVPKAVDFFKEYAQINPSDTSVNYILNKGRFRQTVIHTVYLTPDQCLAATSKLEQKLPETPVKITTGPLQALAQNLTALTQEAFGEIISTTETNGKLKITLTCDTAIGRQQVPQLIKFFAGQAGDSKTQVQGKGFCFSVSLNETQCQEAIEGLNLKIQQNISLLAQTVFDDEPEVSVFSFS